LGGPLAEVDGEGDAMAVVACEDHHLFAARMAAKDGAHSFGEKNGSAPAISNTHRGEGRVQVTDAIFKRAETGGGFAVGGRHSGRRSGAVFLLERPPSGSERGCLHRRGRGPAPKMAPFESSKRPHRYGRSTV